ncbi:MAG: glycosyl hydrolase family 28-related protein, partial [Pseudomonadota bacterium]
MERRQFLTRFGTSLAAIAMARPAFAQATLDALPLRGSISAVDYGVVPDAPRDQSVAFRKMLDQAGAKGDPVFLPAGNYVIADVDVPEGTVLSGVPGRTILVQGAGSSVLRLTG